MKFFKDAIDYTSRVLSPTAAVWVLMYSIPNAIATMGGNSTEVTYPDGFSHDAHVFVAGYSTVFAFMACNAIIASCYHTTTDESSDEENPSVEEDTPLIGGDYALEPVTEYRNS